MSEFRQRAARRARRMHEARTRPQRLWAGAGLVGSVGWMIALPTVAGAWGGHLLDRELGTRLSFTLGLLMLGLFAGGYAVWRLLMRRPP